MERRPERRPRLSKTVREKRAADSASCFLSQRSSHLDACCFSMGMSSKRSQEMGCAGDLELSIFAVSQSQPFTFSGLRWMCPLLAELLLPLHSRST